MNPEGNHVGESGAYDPALAAPIDAVNLPLDWLCWRRTGISGRYEGAGSGQFGQPLASAPILDLRLDVDVRYSTDSPVMDRVSGDLYSQRQVIAPAAAVRVYRESWIVDKPKVVWERCRAVITGVVRYWRGIHPLTTARIVVRWSRGAIQSATVEFLTHGTVQSRFVCAYKSDNFRDLFLELDYASSVNVSPAVPVYDTHAHNNRPGDISQRNLTIPGAYREAGVGVTVNADHSVIDDSAAGFASWSVGELHDCMETWFSRYGNTWPAWNMWGLQAGKFDNAGVGGIMFDAAAGFGGAGRSPDRQGFAVFRKHPWFDNLVDGPPANQAQARAMRHYLYTWVHEAGHAFNFLHSWDKGRPNSLSWMNYDWKYDQLNGADQFWANFRFRFDDDELIHLRHGDRASVVMGGDPWASGGHLETPTGTTVEAGPDQPVELLLRSKDYFGFMEPVDVEFRLRNRTNAPVRIDARLDPTFGNTTLFVLSPDGRTTQFDSVVCQYGLPEYVDLEPTGASEKGPDRFSELVGVTYGRGGGFLFSQPGQYQLRAVYCTTDGVMAVSNTLTMRVGHPVTPREDRFAADFFTPAVGLVLSFDGSMSPHLSTGMDTLTAAAEEFAGEPLGNKAADVVARSLSRDFYRRDIDEGSDKLVRHHTADPGTALQATEAALAAYQGDVAPANNIAYHQLVDLRTELHTAEGNSKAAQQELGALATDLAQRGANDNVIQTIQQDARSLSANPSKPKRSTRK